MSNPEQGGWSLGRVLLAIVTLGLSEVFGHQVKPESAPIRPAPDTKPAAEQATAQDAAGQTREQAIARAFAAARQAYHMENAPQGTRKLLDAYEAHLTHTLPSNVSEVITQTALSAKIADLEEINRLFSCSRFAAMDPKASALARQAADLSAAMTMTAPKYASIMTKLNALLDNRVLSERAKALLCERLYGRSGDMVIDEAEWDDIFGRAVAKALTAGTMAGTGLDAALKDKLCEYRTALISAHPCDIAELASPAAIAAKIEEWKAIAACVAGSRIAGTPAGSILAAIAADPTATLAKVNAAEGMLRMVSESRMMQAGQKAEVLSQIFRDGRVLSERGWQAVLSDLSRNELGNRTYERMPEPVWVADHNRARLACVIVKGIAAAALSIEPALSQRLTAYKLALLKSLPANAADLVTPAAIAAHVADWKAIEKSHATSRIRDNDTLSRMARCPMMTAAKFDSAEAKLRMIGESRMLQEADKAELTRRVCTSNGRVLSETGWKDVLQDLGRGKLGSRAYDYMS